MFTRTEYFMYLANACTVKSAQKLVLMKFVLMYIFILYILNKNCKS